MWVNCIGYVDLAAAAADGKILNAQMVRYYPGTRGSNTSTRHTKLVPAILRYCFVIVDTSNNHLWAWFHDNCSPRYLITQNLLTKLRRSIVWWSIVRKTFSPHQLPNYSLRQFLTKYLFNCSFSNRRFSSLVICLLDNCSLRYFPTSTYSHSRPTRNTTLKTAQEHKISTNFHLHCHLIK